MVDIQDFKESPNHNVGLRLNIKIGLLDWTFTGETNMENTSYSHANNDLLTHLPLTQLPIVATLNMTPPASKIGATDSTTRTQTNHKEHKVNRPTVHNTKQWTIAGYNLVDSKTIHRTYREAYGTCTWSTATTTLLSPPPLLQ
jgi:hypothetical protein